jgi:hypothetical protein
MTDTTPAYPPPPTNPWQQQTPHEAQPYGYQDPFGYQPYATPQYGMQPPYGTPKPSAYWPLSVVGFLFSFLVGGIALYFSAQVGRRWNRGDVAGARKASKTAMILGIAGIVVGVLALIYLY